MTSFKAAFVAVLGALALSGCLFNPMPEWWATTDGGPPSHHVQIIGDSLVVNTQWNGGPRSNHVLTDELAAAGYASSVNATIGAVTDDLVGKESRPEEDILVIALGTNDVAYRTVEGSRANLEGFVAQSPSPCVVLVGLGTIGLDGASWYNAMLQEIAAANAARVTYADWAALSAPHPEWFFPNNPHMTLAGIAAYRQLILDGVAGCAETTTTTTTEPTETTTTTT